MSLKLAKPFYYKCVNSELKILHDLSVIAEGVSQITLCVSEFRVLIIILIVLLMLVVASSLCFAG